MVGICSIGLVKAADSYDLTKGIKFSSYCMRVMTNEVLQEIRKKKRRDGSCCVSLDDELDDGRLVAEIVPDNKDYFKHIYLSDVYRAAIAKLSDRERRIIHAIIIQGKTQHEVGKALGWSQSYISRLYKAAIEKIKQDEKV